MATFRLDDEYEIEYDCDFSIPVRMLRLSRTTPILFLEPHSLLASIVQKLDSAILRINHYPVDKC